MISFLIKFRFYFLFFQLPFNILLLLVNITNNFIIFVGLLINFLNSFLNIGFLKSLEELDDILEGFDTFELEIFKFISLLLSVKSLKYEPPNFTSGSEIP